MKYEELKYLIGRGYGSGSGNGTIQLK